MTACRRILWAALVGSVGGAGCSAHAAPGEIDGSVDVRFQVPGAVRAIVRQADGKLIVGGEFSTMNGVARNNVARLNANGSLDLSFDPGPKTTNSYDRTYTVSMQGDKVLVGGELTFFGGQPASALVRLNSDGSRDGSFEPPSFQLWTGAGAVSVALDRGDGKIVAGGIFNNVGGQARGYLVRLEANGTLDASFNPVIDGSVAALVPVAGGRWLIGGRFTTVSGESRRGIARIEADGSLDASFASVPLGPDGVVDSLSVQIDGRIIFTGNGNPGLFVGRVLSDGGADPSFTPEAIPGVFPRANPLPGGDILVNGPSGGGLFRTFRLSRLQPNGSMDSVAQPSGFGDLLALLPLGDGSVVLGGQISNVNNQLRFGLAAVRADGTLNPDFHPDAAHPGEVRRIVPLSGGRWGVVGAFSGAFTHTTRGNHRWVSRLTSDLRPDVEFKQLSRPPEGGAYAVAEDAGGRLLVGGRSYGENPALFRLTSSGELDLGFDVTLGAADTVRDIVVQPDGRFLAAGSMTQVNGVPHSTQHLFRFGPDGVMDSTFSPSLPGPINDIALDTNGRVLAVGSGFAKRFWTSGAGDPGFNQKLAPGGQVQTVATLPGSRTLIAGDFTSLKGLPAGRIARLTAFGEPDPSFQAGSGADGMIRSLAVRSDGDLFIGGEFSHYNGQSRRGIAQLTPDGALRTEFDPGEGFNGSVETVAVSTDGNLLAGGNFTRAGSFDRFGFARLLTAPLRTVAPAPLAPGGFTSTAVASNNVLLIWSDGVAESGYVIERRESGSFDWLTMAELPADSTFMNDGSVVPGGRYQYRVVAWNQSGDSPPAVSTEVVLPTREGLAGDAVAGSALDLWDTGEVTATAVQADGRTIIAGSFTVVNGTPALGLARLHADGTLDPSFHGSAVFTAASSWGFELGAVDALGLQSDGKIIIGGAFNYVNGVSARGIARLLADGSLDPTFTAPSVDSYVGALAVLPDDRLVIGRNSRLGGSGALVQRLEPNGTLDTSFTSLWLNSGSVHAMAAQPDGKVLVAGEFRVNFSETSLTRLNVDGTHDSSFAVVAALPINTTTKLPRWAVALQSDGKILLGGEFETINDVSRSRIARLNANGSLDTTFMPGSGADDTVRWLGQLPDGRVLVGGHFQRYDGQPRSCWAVVSAAGTLEPGDAAIRYAHVRSALRLPDGRILALGNFSSAAGVPHSGLVRLAADATTVDASFSVQCARPGVGTVIVTQPDGKALVAGSFTSVGAPLPSGLFRPSLCRLNADGSVDEGFDAGTGFHVPPIALAVGPTGRTFASGDFKAVDGVTRTRIVALHPDGRVDGTFDPGTGTNATVSSVTAEADGGATLGGAFSQVAGQARMRIARLHADGSLAPDFAGLAGPNGNVLASHRQSDGKLLIGGSFSRVNGLNRANLARLNADGSLDASFDLPTDGRVSVFAPGPAHSIFAGGNFSSISGLPRFRVGRLHADGTVDPGFVPQLVSTPQAPATFAAMASDSEGRLYVAGVWSGSLPYRDLRIVRLLASGSLDGGFDVGTLGANAKALAAIDAGLVVGGTFTEWGGQPRSGLILIRSVDANATPGAPGDLTANATEFGVTIAWTSALHATGFIVERRAHNSSLWVPLATVPATANGFADPSPQSGSRYHYRVTAFNAAGTSPASQQIEVILPTTFAQWRAGHGIPDATPDDDDSDDDGVPLFAEYALDLAPRSSEHTGLPTLSVAGGLIEFHFLHARADVIYEVEASDDLLTWTSEGVVQGAQPLYRVASIPKAGQPQRFLRLRMRAAGP